MVEFAFTAIGQMSFVPDQDYLLLELAGTANASVVMSTDPSLTALVAATPGTQTQVPNSAVLRIRTNNNQHYVWNSNVQNLLETGRTYYVAAAGATRVLAYLQPVN